MATDYMHLGFYLTDTFISFKHETLVMADEQSLGMDTSTSILIYEKHIKCFAVAILFAILKFVIGFVSNFYN